MLDVRADPRSVVSYVKPHVPGFALRIISTIPKLSIAMNPENLSPADQQLMLELAALAPPPAANFTPPGLLDPNYVAPNRGGAVIAVSVASTVIALVVVCLRVLTRATQKNFGIGRDDYTILLAIVRDISPHAGSKTNTFSQQSFAIIQCVFTVLEVLRGGAGKHSFDTTLHESISQVFVSYQWHIRDQRSNDV
jgi:hypothetical protein